MANLSVFFTLSSSGYWLVSQQQNSPKLTIGEIIQSQTPSISVILVFGDDWSSAFAYHSQRRAFTLPGWAPSGHSPRDILLDPDLHLGGQPVGAVVSRKPISEADLLPSCKIAEQGKIEEWHLYLCKPLITPQTWEILDGLLQQYVCNHALPVQVLMLMFQGPREDVDVQEIPKELPAYAICMTKNILN